MGLLVGGVSLMGHPADITLLRILVQQQALELRFTFNLCLLEKIIQVDANEDGQITPQELATAMPKLDCFLREQAKLKINGKAAPLAQRLHFDPLWPSRGTVTLTEVERSVDVTYSLHWPEVIDDISLSFPDLARMGAEASIQTTFEQGNLALHVPFSLSSPEYVYDTGFAAEQIFQIPTARP